MVASLLAGALLLAIGAAQLPSLDPTRSYSSAIYYYCPGATPSPSGSVSGTSFLPPVPTPSANPADIIINVYITAYINICPGVGFCTPTYTVTQTCTKGCPCSALPIPSGFTVTEKTCQDGPSSGAVITVTEPCTACSSKGSNQNPVQTGASGPNSANGSNGVNDPNGASDSNGVNGSNSLNSPNGSAGSQYTGSTNLKSAAQATGGTHLSGSYLQSASSHPTSLPSQTGGPTLSSGAGKVVLESLGGGFMVVMLALTAGFMFSL